MRISLKVEAGPHQGQVFDFEGHSNFLVGRSRRAHFRLPDKDKYFSRIHFMIEVNPPLSRLMDMGSTNGTLVNGQKVASVDLKHGDLIKAGITILRVSLADVESASPSSADLSLPTTIPRVDNTAPPTETLATRFVPQPEPSMATANLPTETAITGTCPNCGRPVAKNGPTAAGTPSSGETQRLCAACLDRAFDHPEPIPGYRMVRELGRGGMGVVYLAVRESDGQQCAVKMIRPAVAVTPRETEKFLREAKILSGLSHPNIVSFREMGESNGSLFFAMDFVNGSDGSQLQKSLGGPMPIPRAVGLVCQMLHALDHAHSKGFVHRDIKPANLLVAQDEGRETVKLSDFGLARVYQASTMSGLTMKGDLGGTLPYMAPEQITELRDAKPPVDQYSAGATLYKFLTNQHVFDFDKKLELQIMKILLEPPIPIRDRRADIPEGLAAIIHKSLAKEPGDRFKDVREMRQALAAFV
jgi:hypothetical protein